MPSQTPAGGTTLPDFRYTKLVSDRPLLAGILPFAAIHLHCMCLVESVAGAGCGHVCIKDLNH